MTRLDRCDDGARIRAKSDDIETAETAFRRIVRRKLIERGFHETQIEAKIEALLRKGLPLDPSVLDESD